MNESLLDDQGAARVFDGPAYDPARDTARLTSQIGRVFELMRDGHWRSLTTIHNKIGDHEASISAQLRHLRKARFGGHDVQRRSAGGGLHEYRLIVKGPLLDGADRSTDPAAVPCPACGSGRLRPREDAVVAAARTYIDALDAWVANRGENAEDDLGLAEHELRTALEVLDRR